jgi:hypothetical protein
MRAFNVAMCLVVSALLALVIFEVGLRVIGKGPQPTINQFDPVTGWSKIPGAKAERKTSEYHVHYEINALGLRDDPMTSPAKPAGSLRVLALGDSFVLGYTVERNELFVDLLEKRWRAEGRNVDVVNAGTEGWSTDQEVAWFEAHGAEFQPDVVLLFPYENDLYWNSQPSYRRFPKPRYTPFGNLEHAVLADPGPRQWYESTAIGSLYVALQERPLSWSVSDPRRRLAMEDAALFVDPPDFMKEAIGRTRGALVALKAACAKQGAKLVIAPIPGKSVFDPRARELLGDRLNPATLLEKLMFWKKRETLDPANWSPAQPVETFLALAKQLDIEAFDARAFLRESAQDQRAQYFPIDWHLNGHGNRVFANFIHDEVERTQLFPAAFAAKQPAPPPTEPADDSFPQAPLWFAGLWVVLATGFALTYRDTPWWKAALGVGAMLGLVFAIALGGSALLKLLDPRLATFLLVLAVMSLLGFVFYKLGRRLGTIAELFKAFTLRGHWYLMPLVVVLLTVGSLLVVAASSPLIAPFIYTLF